MATWHPFEKVVDEVLRESGRGATVEYNKGAVMILPPGATKGAGLRFALQELGYSEHNVIACGDAENDRSLFEVAEYAVAVAEATKDIKHLADYVLSDKYPAGIRDFIKSLKECALPTSKNQSKNQFVIGRRTDGALQHIHPQALINGNLGVVGGSASGKSWLAGLLAEQLLQKGYQICIIDPEGDYSALRAFPHTLLLGGNAGRLPQAIDVVTLSEYTNVSLVLDLSLFNLDERSAYVTDLLQALFNLHARRGRPHWFLLDEIHSFCPPEGGPLTDLILKGMKEGGICVVSYRPSIVAPALLKQVDNWLLTRLQLPEEIKYLEQLLPGKPDEFRLAERLPSLSSGDAVLLQGECGETITKLDVESFRVSSRKVPHVRHLHKYLRAPLPKSKRFYFTHTAASQPRVAASMWEFREAIADISTTSLRFHLERGDFELWLKQVLHDEELARRIRKIRNRHLKDEELREALLFTVADRYEELESLI